MESVLDQRAKLKVKFEGIVAKTIDCKNKIRYIEEKLSLSTSKEDPTPKSSITKEDPIAESSISKEDPTLEPSISIEDHRLELSTPKEDPTLEPSTSKKDHTPSFKRKIYIYCRWVI